MNSTTSSWLIGLTMVASLCCDWLSVTPAVAQETGLTVRQRTASPTSEVTPESPTKESKAGDTPVVEPVAEDQICLFRLAHIDATSVVETIKALFMQSGREQVIVTADERTNTVLVSAGQKCLERIADLIEQLDVLGGKKQDQRLEVYHLEHVDPTSAAKVLTGVLDLANARIAADNRTDSLIMRGPSTILEEAERLLKHLDREVDADSESVGHPRTHQIRIVLLANGISAIDAPGSSDELEEVIANLSEVVGKDLRQMCQVIVNTELQEEFQMDSRPLLGKTASACRISGALELRHATATPVLKLQLRLQLIPGEEPSREVNLDTIIAAPYGHYVLIGGIPVDDKTVVVLARITPDI